METKWTPGPWSVGRHGTVHGGAFHEYTNGSAQEQIASVQILQRSTYSDVVAEKMANTHLIAAAPELYAALADLAEWHSWSLAESERRAAEFQRETGMLAPFKDAGAVANLPEEFNAQRAEAWRVWCAKKNAEISGAAWAALAKARGE